MTFLQKYDIIYISVSSKGYITMFQKYRQYLQFFKLFFITLITGFILQFIAGIATLFNVMSNINTIPLSIGICFTIGFVFYTIAIGYGVKGLITVIRVITTTRGSINQMHSRKNVN